jgi:SAM-dependent methyltransferase
MNLSGDATDTRTPERLQAHYEIEIALADRLRNAPPAERRRLYGTVYDELFARVPDHPQLTRREDAASQAAYARRQVQLIRQLLPELGHYVEIGAGDCATVRGVAGFARIVTAVEVSRKIVPADLPPNVEVAISDGVSVPLAPKSADLVYSNQVMEHLHPDDAMEQLRNIATVLKPRGRYVCITPNRLTGPHDISAHFDAVPRGFHLREYTYAELVPAFRTAGFREVHVLEGAQGRALDLLIRQVGRLTVPVSKAIERASERPLILPLGPYLLAERWASLLGRTAATRRVLDRAVGTIRLIAAVPA